MYQSSLNDKQWDLIKSYLKRPDPRGARRKYSMRLVIDAIFYRVKTGCQWRMLPKEFPPWQNVYNHFWRMKGRGVWQKINDELNKNTEKKSRDPQPSMLIIDSQSVKSSYEGEHRGFDGNKKVKGRKRSIMVDTQGLMWAVHVHAANFSDTKYGCFVASRALSKLPRVKKIMADQGYRNTFEQYIKSWGKEIEISKKITDPEAVSPFRWIVERSFGWLGGQRIMSKDYEKTVSSSENMLLLCSIARNMKNAVF